MSRVWITVPGEDVLPKCPECHSTEHVRKGALYRRKYYPLTRYYVCSLHTPKDSAGFLKEADRGWKHPANDAKSTHPEAKDRARYRQALNELNELVPPPPNMEELSPTSRLKEKPTVSATDAIFFGNWKIKRSLARSLACMFRVANGFTPTTETLDTFISTIIEAEVATFRLNHRDEILRGYGRPVAKPVDPIATIREAILEDP
ncbi:MAG TPA: hypothetical protein VOA88_20995 [Candidatus Dormibacteraeota bacterium]|nr:hypothetical protein [Candidatus Dormibacteraeota bacterium]